jgi:hypothetical protein
MLVDQRALSMTVVKVYSYSRHYEGGVFRLRVVRTGDMQTSGPTCASTLPKTAS